MIITKKRLLALWLAITMLCLFPAMALANDNYVNQAHAIDTLTPQQIRNLLGSLNEGETSRDIVRFALMRLGDPYSKAKRGQGDYVDCSYFARWCYQKAGVSYYKASSAAEQAIYCVNNDLCISYSNLEPGDLIFWAFKENGRFKNISHVGIYSGDGYVIDASSSLGMVVYRPVFGVDSIVVCARPYTEPEM